MFTLSVTPNGEYLIIQIKVPMESAAWIADELRRAVASIDDVKPANGTKRRLDDVGTEQHFAEHKAKLSALAEEIAPQITATPPDQRRSAINRIAAEHGLTAEILKFILARRTKAVVRKDREERLKNRAQVSRRLRREGKTWAEVASALGISERLLRYDLREYRKIISKRRRELRDFRQRFDKTQGDA